MSKAVIVDFVRTPFTAASSAKREGALARVYPTDLEGMLTRALIERTGIDPKDIECVLTGCAFPEGPTGLNEARNIVLLPDSGLRLSTAGTTVNKFCGSSMEAIVIAAGKIALGSGEAFICTGVENMSVNPDMMGFKPMLSPNVHEGNAEGFMNMGRTAENLANQYKIDRRAQDDFAAASHKKAAAAQDKGLFKAEIVPVNNGKRAVDSDDLIRRFESDEKAAEALGKLKPAFMQNGSVTAGTSSPFTDGASAVMVVSEDYARKHKLPVLARILSTGESGCAPEIMGIGPVSASKKALKRAGLTMKDIDIVELNEAFAAQALSVARDLGIDPARLNLDGGAIALGHPLGASGARITGKAAQLLKRENRKYALATMCIGGGQGIAIVLERFEP